MASNYHRSRDQRPRTGQGQRAGQARPTQRSTRGSVTSLYPGQGQGTDTIPRPYLNRATEKLPPGKKYTVVAFDIEGTGLLDENPEIVQLSAVYKDSHGGLAQFDQHILPERPFIPRAAQVTGFEVRGGRLYRKGKALSTVSLQECLLQFVDWLEQIPNPPILVGHNVYGYDAPLLAASLEKEGVYGDFLAVMEQGGFADSLEMSREVFIGQRKHGLQDLRQAFLSKRRYEAHSALGDSKALLDILNLREVRLEHILEQSMSVTDTYGTYSQQFIDNIIQNRPSLAGLMESQDISGPILNKLAGAGYRYEHIRLVVQKFGMHGIRELYEDILGLRKFDNVEMKLFVYAAEDLMGFLK